MRTESINDSNWKEVYRKAMLETDQAKMPQHIDDARNAILGRVEQLLVDPVSGEHKLLKDALVKYKFARSDMCLLLERMGAAAVIEYCVM